jgi:hypothetical protein
MTDVTVVWGIVMFLSSVTVIIRELCFPYVLTRLCIGVPTQSVAGVQSQLSHHETYVPQPQNFTVLNLPISSAGFPITWVSLVEGPNCASFGVITQAEEDSDETSSEASAHSITSRCHVTPVERRRVLAQDRCCFFTNGSSDTEVAHILDSPNAGNKELVTAFPSLGD